MASIAWDGKDGDMARIVFRDAAGKRLAKRDDARALSLFRAEGAKPEDIRRMVGL
jgi:glutamyl-Q tRNA(Asp) synthetase